MGEGDSSALLTDPESSGVPVTNGAELVSGCVGRLFCPLLLCLQPVLIESARYVGATTSVKSVLQCNKNNFLCHTQG